METYSSRIDAYNLANYMEYRWDVGRLHDQTVACIWRVNIRDNKYYATLVNLIVLGRQAETKTFVQQAIDLKELIEIYNPREVVIDCNGLGR